MVTLTHAVLTPGKSLPPFEIPGRSLPESMVQIKNNFDNVLGSGVPWYFFRTSFFFNNF